MSKWKYDGYTKIKIGQGRSAKMLEKRCYTCPYCSKTIRIDYGGKLPNRCPNCYADMDEGEIK